MCLTICWVLKKIKRYYRLLDKIETSTYLYWWVVRFKDGDRDTAEEQRGDIRHPEAREEMKGKRFSRGYSC